jgi:hypothetical protein
MKKFALLVLALPLAACATPQHEAAQVRSQQLAQARISCSADYIPASGLGYGRCLNKYLQSQYGWHLVELSNGSLSRGSAPIEFNNTPYSY